MEHPENYIEINRQTWNTRTDYHLASEFYDVAGFLKGNTSLKEIEVALLGDVKDKTILHLQCHFGQDSISLSRMGAKVTGVDLSDNGIEKARSLNDQAGTDAEFICCDLYELPQHLDKTFDIVFTTYGTIGWLPDLDKWAAVIARYLKPGGQLYFVEFHPFVWMYDDQFEKITYNYFNAEPIIETESGTYAQKDAPINQQYVGWNHNIAEVLTSLLQHGMEIKTFNEYDYSPYNVFAGMVESEPGKFRVAAMDNKIPLVYAIVTEKK